ATSPWIFWAACIRPLMSGILNSDIGLDLLDAGAEGVEHRPRERVLERLAAAPLRLLALAIGLGLEERAGGASGSGIGEHHHLERDGAPGVAGEELLHG